MLGSLGAQAILEPSFGPGSLSELEVAYRVLSASKDGFFQGNALSRAVMKARRIAVRWLYISMGLFMVVLFMGLATSLIEGKQ
ncbi:hypothetical protein [Stenotrophomonas rhizophila]|uniref:hypothetical protein n=1 Tax=Stenotrophomonas rhizophila TaxID=216778 RepID=UPI0028B13025|nr:hypothetical protein [Stenotrophomonas rhizophila]